MLNIRSKLKLLLLSAFLLLFILGCSRDYTEETKAPPSTALVVTSTPGDSRGEKGSPESRPEQTVSKSHEIEEGVPSSTPINPTPIPITSTSITPTPITPTPVSIPVPRGKPVPIPRRYINSRLVKKTELCNYLVIPDLEADGITELDSTFIAGTEDYQERNILLYGTSDGNVGIYDLISGRSTPGKGVIDLGDESRSINNLVIEDENRYVFITSYTHIMSRWSILNKLKEKGEIHLSSVEDDSVALLGENKAHLKIVDITSNNQLLGIASDRGGVLLYDHSFNPLDLDELLAVKGSVETVGFTSDGNHLLVGVSKYLHLYNVKENQYTDYIIYRDDLYVNRNINTVSTIKIDKSYYVVIGTKDSYLIISKFEKGRFSEFVSLSITSKTGIQGDESGLTDIYLSPNSEILAVGTASGYVYLYNTKDLVDFYEKYSLGSNDPDYISLSISNHYSEGVDPAIKSVKITDDNNYLIIATTKEIFVKGMCPDS